MKDILVVAKLKEGKFEKFMGFMQSNEGMNERRNSFLIVMVYCKLNIPKIYNISTQCFSC